MKFYLSGHIAQAERNEVFHEDIVGSLSGSGIDLCRMDSFHYGKAFLELVEIKKKLLIKEGKEVRENGKVSDDGD